MRQTASDPNPSGGTAGRTTPVRAGGAEEGQDPLEYALAAFRALYLVLNLGDAAA